MSTLFLRPLLPKPNTPSRQPTRSQSSSRRMPIRLGSDMSLAWRPGGNITGLSAQQTEITAKQMQILKETVPQVMRIGALWSPTAPSYRPFLQAAEAASGKLSVQLLTAGVSTVADFDGAFATMARDRVDGVLVHGSSLTARHNPGFWPSSH